MTAAARTLAWPTAKMRRYYRAVYATPTSRVAALLVVVPLVCVALTAPLGVPARATVLALALGAATVTDLLWRRIFNWVVVGIVGWVAALHLVAPGAAWTGLPTAGQSAAGFGVCLGFMLLLYLLFRGGEGDVKLLAAVGAAVGPWHGLEALVFGYLLAAIVAVVLIGGRALGCRSVVFQARTLPMAPFLSAGVALTLGLPGTP